MLTRRELFSTSSAALILGLAILAVHLPSLLLPYYFVDDLWLYRRPEAGFPGIYDTVVIQQGRPVFAALAVATQAGAFRQFLDCGDSGLGADTALVGSLDSGALLEPNTVWRTSCGAWTGKRGLSSAETATGA